MFLFHIFMLTCNVMKVVYKYDMDSYNGGYFHSYQQKINENEFTDDQKMKLLNKIHIQFEKKDLLDYLLLETKKKDNSIEFYNRIVRNKLTRPISFFTNGNIDIDCVSSGTIELKNGGLYNDWDFKF